MQTIELPDATYEIARALAGDGPIEAVIAQAIEDLRRRRMLTALNEDFATLRADPEAWAQELSERNETEGTIGDDLGSD